MVVEDELQGGLNVVFQQSVALATKIMFDMVKDAFTVASVGKQSNSCSTATYCHAGMVCSCMVR